MAYSRCWVCGRENVFLCRVEGLFVPSIGANVGAGGLPPPWTGIRGSLLLRIRAYPVPGAQFERAKWPICTVGCVGVKLCFLCRFVGLLVPSIGAKGGAGGLPPPWTVIRGSLMLPIRASPRYRGKMAYSRCWVCGRENVFLCRSEGLFLSSIGASAGGSRLGLSLEGLSYCQ